MSDQTEVESGGITATDLSRILSGVPIFGGVPDFGLDIILAQAALNTLNAGDILVREGEPAREMFVVVQGSVSVYTHGPQGGERHLRRLGRGDCLGEMALIDIQPRSASVRADEPTQVLSLAFEDFIRLYKANLELYTLVTLNIAREISRRLRQANRLVARLGHRDLSTDEIPVD